MVTCISDYGGVPCTEARDDITPKEYVHYEIEPEAAKRITSQTLSSWQAGLNRVFKLHTAINCGTGIPAAGAGL